MISRTPRNDIDAFVAEYARLYEPLIGVAEAAKIGHVEPPTIYDWKYKGELEGCIISVGWPLLFHRDRSVRFIFTKGGVSKRRKSLPPSEASP